MNDPVLDNITKSQIGGDYYTFKIFLVSGDNRGRQIKPAAIKELVIEDSFETFYHKGYIALDNSYDYLERGNPAGEAEFDAASTDANKGFLFRGDSRDFLYVEIKPRISTENSSSTETELSDKIFKMLYVFSIYNSEEKTENEPNRKYKILYFWDNYYEVLRNKNVDFSTAELINNDSTQLTDNARGVYTGDAIKALLTKAYDPSNGPGVSFSDGWDQGSTILFFSSPAQFKGTDSLDYLLQRHVSTPGSNYDQSFLEIERDSRAFSFTNLKSYFDKAFDKSTDGGGAYYLETYILGAYNDSDNTIPVQEIRFTPKIGNYMSHTNNLSHYTLDFMPGLHSQEALVTRMVHSYDNGDKAFSIDIERNSVDSAMDIYNKNYVTTLRGDRSPVNNFLPGYLKTSNKNVKHIFSVSSTNADQRLAQGRNKFLRASIFLNQIISFSVDGSTHRQSGRFIGLDREGAIHTSDFDSKLLGIYFIVNVRHIFRDGNYINELKCVKTYANSDIFLNNKAL